MLGLCWGGFSQVSQRLRCLLCVYAKASMLVRKSTNRLHQIEKRNCFGMECMTDWEISRNYA